MPSVLVVTFSYPFGMGEPFFTAELQALAKRFTKVTILPVSRTSMAQREVPKNVNILNPLLSSKLQDIRNCFDAPLHAIQTAVENFRSLVAPLDLANATRLGVALSRRIDVLSQAGYNLVYLYWGFPLTALVSRFCTIAPCVQRFHGSDLWGSSGGAALRPGVTAHMRNLRSVIFASEKGRSTAQVALPFGIRGKLHVRYLGSADFGPVARMPYSDKLSIVSCAFINQNKRLDRIARVVGCLSNSAPVTWTHVGGGSPSSINELRNLAGPHAKTEFVGSVPHGDISGIFHSRRPNILMSMSDSEGLAINVLEAMSADVPVICTDVGGMSEAVNDRVGMLVEKKDFDNADLLTQRVLSEIGPGGLLAEASPRSVWLSKFDAVSNAALFAAELREICDAQV